MNGNENNASICNCQKLYDELIKKIKKYHPSTDFSIIEKAYKTAKEAHGEQIRKSGEPYIIHPLCVAIILAELEMDLESIVAGILHDVIEDTKYSFDNIKEMFNEEIANIVDGVTKLDKFTYSSKEELQAENYRKMFLAMAKDIRVILIKVADRLHNMRTLQFMTEEKQEEKAQETLDIYAPLATRLGIFKIKVELEDLCFRYLNKEAYYDLATKIKQKQHEREDYVEKIVSEIYEKCKESKIVCEITGRPKHFFSIYKKMVKQDKTLDQIFDLFAVRIIVNDIRECYEVLGIVHEMYKPIPSRFKDYIAMPKVNMYQSLHNTLIGPSGIPFEVQIRTLEMHRIAEYGIAAHWKYKSGKTTEDGAEEEKLAWLRQILEWQKDMSDNKEFMDTIKTDLDSFNENVYCFSPSGEVKSLPTGANPIDFAYSIHSAVGNTMVGARVNGKIVTFDYKLQNGDRVEVITSQNSRGPSMDWLKTVKSSQAKNKINQWFKMMNKEENILKGKEMLEKEAKRKGFSFSELANPTRFKKVLARYSFKDWEAIYAAIGHGGLKEGQIINRLIEELNKEQEKNKTAEDIIKETEKIISNFNTPEKMGLKRAKNDSGIVIHGLSGLDVRVSKCCSPLPGDEIIGFITKGRGVSVHRTDCINIINLLEDDRKRLIDANWDIQKEAQNKEFLAEIRIVGVDRLGILVDITRILTDEKVPVKNINARTTKTEAIVDVVILIKNREELENICKKMKSIKGIYDIERITT